MDVCAIQMLHRNLNQSKSEAADRHVSGLCGVRGATFTNWDAILPWWALNSFEHLSSNLEIESLAASTQRVWVQSFGVPLGGLSCSFVSHFWSTIVDKISSNVSQKIVEKKSLASSYKAIKTGSANYDADKTKRQPVLAGSASWVLKVSSKFMLHTLESPWRFCHTFPRELEDWNVYWFSWNTKTLEDWSTFSSWKNNNAHPVFQQFP